MHLPTTAYEGSLGPENKNSNYSYVIKSRSGNEIYLFYAHLGHQCILVILPTTTLVKTTESSTSKTFLVENTCFQKPTPTRNINFKLFDI